MSISPYIKEIGRGKEGARSLTETQAHDLMSQVLDGQVTDLEVGAFAIAMRIKGESVCELAGFLQAASERCLRLEVPRAAVLLPSYNGARRLPNLTPLLAMMLSRRGIPVLVHGMPEDPTRVTSADVFGRLGLPAARHAADILGAWRRQEPASIQTDALCPPLARLLNARWIIGLRNSGHTVAKLLDPFPDGKAVRVVNHTHPEYGHMLAEFLRHTGANALLMRGTEGEPVADARRQRRLDVFIGGISRPDLGVPAQEGVLRELPDLPRDFDAATTAQYIQSVLAGESPVPDPLTRQVECLLRIIDAMK